MGEDGAVDRRADVQVSHGVVGRRFANANARIRHAFHVDVDALARVVVAETAAVNGKRVVHATLWK